MLARKIHQLHLCFWLTEMFKTTLLSSITATIRFFNSFILLQQVALTVGAENRPLTKEEDGFRRGVSPLSRPTLGLTFSGSVN